MRWIIGIAGLGALVATGLVWPDQPTKGHGRAPEFKEVSEWLNTKPLHMRDLRGKVVVVHFWTFG